MAVGDTGQVGVRSYLAVGRESTLGTYASATTAIEFISSSIKTEIDSMKLDTMAAGKRGFSRRVQLDKKVQGTIESYLHPQESVLMIASALGGALVSNSLTSAADHSITAGNYDTTTAILGLSFNSRKGDGLTWRYSGGRVNSLKISGTIGEPLKVSAEVFFRDSTQQSDDIAAILSISSVMPFTYVDGNYKYADTEANAANSTNSERIQAFELTINNNIEYGAPARELGSRTPRILPARRRDIEFKITQRFDTTTTWTRFTQATQGSVELFMSGQTISAEYNYEMTIRMPKVFYNSPDMELTGADQVLQSEIVFDVLDGDPDTTTGKDIGFTIRNNVVSY